MLVLLKEYIKITLLEDSWLEKHQDEEGLYRNFKEELPPPLDGDKLFKDYFDDARSIGMSIMDARAYATMHTRNDMERHKKVRNLYRKNTLQRPRNTKNS